MNSDHLNSAVTILLVTVLLFNTVSGQANCPNRENYQPCVCSRNLLNGNIILTCDSIPLTLVQDIFQRTKPFDWDQINLILPKEENSIPDNILVNHRATSVDLQCASPELTIITVNPNAFQSSSSFLASVEISLCDLSQLDWSFLTGFQGFRQIQLTNSTGVDRIAWETLPLDTLDSLWVRGTQGVNEWTNLPNLNGLVSLILNNVQLVDATADRFVSWAFDSFSSTMKGMLLEFNQLTRIPTLVASFPNLNTFSVLQSDVTVVNEGALTLGAPSVVLVDLSGNSIERIQPDAFKGNFEAAKVLLLNNKLSRFESGVFQGILEQMNQSNLNGTLRIDSNPIDCETDTCHLAWLIRDNPDLLTYLADSGSCSNGTAFEELDPAGFDTLNCQ